MEDRKLFSECAGEVEREYHMGGLSEGLYEDFAWDTMNKYLKRRAPSANSRFPKLCAITVAACCSPKCEWFGIVSECVHMKHDREPLCPECNEVVETRTISES